GANTLFRGVARTRGHTPPEVARFFPFSAVRADLWCCGKILEQLCNHRRPSVERDYLLRIAQALMDEDPKKRPMMADVLNGIADSRVGGNQGVDTGRIADPIIYPDWVPMSVPGPFLSKPDFAS
ncbi:hypothetical protein BD779DRAFT_1593738, partial [Infundibulicybe gibba]